MYTFIPLTDVEGRTLALQCATPGHMFPKAALFHYFFQKKEVYLKSAQGSGAESLSARFGTTQVTNMFCRCWGAAYKSKVKKDCNTFFFVLF